MLKREAEDWAGNPIKTCAYLCLLFFLLNVLKNILFEELSGFFDWGSTSILTAISNYLSSLLVGIVIYLLLYSIYLPISFSRSRGNLWMLFKDTAIKAVSYTHLTLPTILRV